MFVQLLREKFDPIKDEVKDILSEIKALRMELTKGQADPEVVARLQRCTRYLIAEHSKDLRKITEFVAGSFDRAVLGLVNSDTLEQFLQKHGTKQRIVSAAEIEKTSEIKALRMELTKGQADPEVVARLQRCTRYLIAEHSKDLRKITEFVAGSFDRAVLGLVNSDTLEQFLQKHGTKQRIVSAAEIEKTEDSITNHEPMSSAGSQSGNTRKALIVVFSAMGVVPEDVTHGRYPHRKYYWRLFSDKTLVMNEVAKEMCDTKFETLKLFIQHENLFAR